MLTKVTDNAMVQTPTMVNHPLIHEKRSRRRGEASLKHQ